MIAILLSPLYLLLNYYIYRWLIKWLRACHKVFDSKLLTTIVLIIYSFFTFSILFGFFLPNNSFGKLIKVIDNYWLGVLLYGSLIIILFDLLRLILKNKFKILKSKKVFVIVGFISIIFVISITIYGNINSKNTVVTNYNIDIDKTSPNLKIALISDLHLGYNTSIKQIEDVVNIINSNNPDIVIIAGDIFDNNYDAINSPDKIVSLFKSIKSKYGVYAVYGNHDINERILAGFTFKNKESVTSDKRMDQMLVDSNITLLKDDRLLIDNSFYLIGRLDYEKLGIATSRLTPMEMTSFMDKSKPIIVIDHEPRELDELSSSGVDIDLSGHTHNGQVFPFTLLTNLLWPNGYGLKKYNNMYSIVSSGVGVFGPNMRVGTNSEVVIINVNFTK